jgi:hypothetical protein
MVDGLLVAAILLVLAFGVGASLVAEKRGKKKGRKK